MTEGGVSKKLTVAAAGIAALLALKDAQSSYLAYSIVGGIILISLSAMGLQAFLDRKNGGQKG